MYLGLREEDEGKGRERGGEVVTSRQNYNLKDIFLWLGPEFFLSALDARYNSY